MVDNYIKLLYKITKQTVKITHIVTAPGNPPSFTVTIAAGPTQYGSSCSTLDAALENLLERVTAHYKERADASAKEYKRIRELVYGRAV